MSEMDVLQIVVYFIVLLLLVKPLGWYMAEVYTGNPCGLNRILFPLEKFCYRIAGVNHTQEMDWKTYAASLLIFNLFGILFLYAILRLQSYLFFNPESFTAVPPDLAFNTAASFITNTNWQAYGGENTLSYTSQMLGLTVQNFLSAASGMAVLIAFIRGFVRRETTHLGNFWVDITRSVLYILLPLALILAIILASQGVIQNLNPYTKVTLLQPIVTTQQTIQEQTLPMGPVASQIAIKQLGTNGGGFFNTNSSHPFENPTPLSNFFEMLAIILIPAAFCYTFGLMIRDKRQGWAVFIAMFILLIPLVICTVIAEQSYHVFDPTVLGSNMEGKETRFGIVNSSVWAAVTTATSNGSVNAMLDSFSPLGGLIPLWLMHLGEVVFGGVGSGLYGMLLLVIITVFISGLMVGRSPEYLGKKIEPYEMKMATVGVLLMPLAVLLLTAIAVVTSMGNTQLNPGAHGFSEILYAFTSMGNNNGSAFAGLNANTAFYNISGGLLMLFLRFWIAIPTLAIAGSLAKKKMIPISSGTLPTHTPLFIILLIGVTLIIGALTFFPALSLGPIVEHLMVWSQHGN